MLLMGIEARFLGLESGGMLPYQLSCPSNFKRGHGRNAFTHMYMRPSSMSECWIMETKANRLVIELKVSGKQGMRLDRS